MHLNKEFKQKLSPANYTTYEMDIKKTKEKITLTLFR